MAIGVNWKEVWADVWAPVWQNTPPVTVPDVAGQSQASGTAEIEAEGLVVAVETAYSSIVAAGDIISQSPVAGSSVLAGSTVTITVSLGEQPVSDAPSGGWASFLRYEQDRERRRRKRREMEEAEEAIKEIAEPVTREIAQILHKQERQDERKADLERLRALVNEFPKDLPPRVTSAIERAQTRQTISALMNLDRELRRYLEDEEVAVMMLLLND